MGYVSGEWVRHKDGYWKMTVHISNGKKISYVNDALDHFAEETDDFLEFHYPDLWRNFEGWGGELHLTWGWPGEADTDEGLEKLRNPPDITRVLLTAFDDILEGRV
jgi:hypothetical protein